MVGLANRYGEKEGLTRDRNGLPQFREARLWVKRNAEVRPARSIQGLADCQGRWGSHSRPAPPKTGSPAHGRLMCRTALAIPSPYFLQPRFRPRRALHKYRYRQSPVVLWRPVPWLAELCCLVPLYPT